MTRFSERRMSAGSSLFAQDSESACTTKRHECAAPFLRKHLRSGSAPKTDLQTEERVANSQDPKNTEKPRRY